MLNRLGRFKDWFVRSIIIVAVGFFLAGLVGGLCFDLDPATIAGWFVLFVVAALAIAFIVALFMFLYWFIIENPSFVVFTILAGIIIVVGVKLFISSDISFMSSLGDAFKGMFAFLG